MAKKTAKENPLAVLHYDLRFTLECILHSKLEPTVKHKA